MTSDAPLLELTNVSKRFDAPEGAPAILVLEGISLRMQRGDSLAIIGPSGSGKSTLLHIIGTLDQPTAGEVMLNGQDLSRLDEKTLAAVRNRQIGFVFQFHYLLPQCTVLENVLVPTLAGQTVGAKTGVARSTSTEEKKNANANSVEAARQAQEKPYDRAVRLLKRVGLAERLAHHPGQLSGGERQRVAVVRALINEPQLLLADEPTGALDQSSAEQLAQLLIELNREEGVALVLVTHARDLARRMGRVLELKQGHLLPCGDTK